VKFREMVQNEFNTMVTKAKLLARNGKVDMLALRVLAIEVALDKMFGEDDEQKEKTKVDKTGWQAER